MPTLKPSSPAEPQLIMFYGGTINVYDAVPPEKVSPLIDLCAYMAAFLYLMWSHRICSVGYWSRRRPSCSSLRQWL